MKKILITGATGQIGTALFPALCKRYGRGNIIVAGHNRKPDPGLLETDLYVTLDVRDRDVLANIVKNHHIDTIYHLASLLSAKAEADPQLAWDVNVNGLYNVLEVARHQHCAVFYPSSIGAFGPTTPQDNTPQVTVQRPRTMYGVSKVTGELLCDYYHHHYGVDARGIRFPGLISYEVLPGGGTTDYAVDIFYAALKDKKYTCFLAPGTYLDMMYMPDAVRAAIEVMEAEPGSLIDRNAFNVTAMSFAPEELAAAIEQHVPGFSISYDVDPVRQAIADSWPNHMDDSAAREQWGWQPRYDLQAMTKDMVEKLNKKIEGTEAEGRKKKA